MVELWWLKRFRWRFSINFFAWFRLRFLFALPRGLFGMLSGFSSAAISGADRKCGFHLFDCVSFIGDSDRRVCRRHFLIRTFSGMAKHRPGILIICNCLKNRTRSKCCCQGPQRRNSALLGHVPPSGCFQTALRLRNPPHPPRVRRKHQRENRKRMQVGH